MEAYFKGKWQTLDRNEPNAVRFLSIGERICLYDLGSAGGAPPPFCWILEGIDLVNFEPDPRGKSEDAGTTLPMAIGPKELNRIFLNQRPTTSSLLRPNRPVVDRYDFSRILQNENDIFRTVGTQEVETCGLDEVIESRNLPSPDFLKVDVQGLSLEVLESAGNSLSQSVIGIQIEVEFLEAYQGQKTFGAVHEYLHAMGFEIFRLTNLNKWFYKTNLRLKLYTGQDSFCDLLYLRSINSIENEPDFWNPERATKAILICLLFDLTDTAAAFFEEMSTKRLIPVEKHKELENLIVNWEDALRFFYKEKTPWLRILLDISPRQILNLILHPARSYARTRIRLLRHARTDQ